ncbi:hypothetical protein K4A83_19050 [Spirulina subsalsa FACHB-351]|uniref:Tryptophan-rich sensory protein n=1 Tax=Spirulina subsalsa FACHB-351 TaxID=234711 RepID=A0ABT3LA31_9CYAN|nr:hypothetical protein [Spirulina subsalsa]MCW6038355.1 hypothetical protein [Spirulina subsalsa FACHB-351]
MQTPERNPFTPKSGTITPLLTFLSIVAAFGINVWSNINPIGGQSIGVIANTTFAGVMITPANYAFIIWGLIYLGLIAFGVYQLLPGAGDRNPLNPVRYGIIISSLAQILWVFLFLARWFWASMGAMGVILTALIWSYGQRRKQPSQTRQERWCVDRPLSLYLGWIAVATIVNGATALYSSGWTELGLGATAWTCIMIGIATVLGGAIALHYRDAIFPGVVIWALVAIALRHSDNFPLITVVVMGVLVLGGAIIRSQWRR